MRKLYALLALAVALTAGTAYATDFKTGDKAPKPLREHKSGVRHARPEAQPLFYPILEGSPEAASSVRRVAPPEGTEMVTILAEDFSKFTAGSENEPDPTDIVDGYGYIPNEYTDAPNWQGQAIRQAGGMCMIDWFDYTSIDGQLYTLPGYLATPVTDLTLNYGKTYLSFRARSLEPEGGTITISWTYPYGSDDDDTPGGTVTWGMYGQWGRYEYIELTNCTSDCQIEISSYSSHVLIDDIRIEKVKPAVYPPVVRRWTNYDDSGEYTTFRANWDHVEGADSYEFHVFRYYDDGIMTKKVVKELNVKDNYFDVTEKNKLDKTYTYYYYVRAKSNGVLSEESAVAQVFDVMTPEITNVYDVTADGYTVDWNPVYNADGYGFFAFLKHNALEDETYCFMNEDFSTIKSSGTIYNPDVSIIGQDYLDDFAISRANWMLYEGAYIDGAIGMHVYTLSNGDRYYGELDSPIMVLAGSDRKITVTADYASPDGVEPVIFLACPVNGQWQFVDSVTIKDITAEWSTRTATLTATSSLCKLAISLDDVSGNYYFLDNLKLSQNLKKGEYVSLPYTYTEFDADQRSYREDTSDHVNGDTYSCSMFAARKIPGSSWFTRYVTSEESEYYDVPEVFVENGLRSVAATADKGFKVHGNMLTATADTRVYTASGVLYKVVPAGSSAQLPAGLWLLSSGKGSSKIAL